MINEQVYGSRDNWIVPGSRTELGHQYSGEVYYYNDIASDDTLKIKVANFDTLSRPVTSFCSQIDGQYPNESYAIRNNWTPSQTESIDKSIVMFGIGGQSGLADVEWWGIDWVTGQSEPTSDVDPVIINHDKSDIVNIGFGLNSAYIPPENYTAGSASNLTTGDMAVSNVQYINNQLWGDQRCFFSTDTSQYYGYHVATAYAFLNFVTQIPIKNLKLYPIISAYKTSGEHKQFNDITNYLAEKNDYPLLGCIEVIFNYRSGLNNSTDYGTSVSLTPIFTDKTTVCRGYQNGTDPNKVIRDENLWYCRNWRRHFVVAGRYGYDSTMSNKIYWVNTYDSRSYTYAIFDAVYQTPDFKFTLDTNKNFTCDVSAMTDNDITHGIRKQLASFGMFFVDSINDINLALDNDKTFLGILKDGVGYGDYSHGSKNRDQDQWNWDSMEENDYDPDNPPTPSPFIPDPNGYNDGMDLAQLDGFETATQRYNLYKAQAHQVFAALWSVWDPFDESDPDLNTAQIDLKTKKMFLTNNPLDCVIGLKYFPVPADMIGTGSDTPVKLGALTLHQAGSSSVEIQCKMAQNSYIHDCGSVYCAPQYQAYSGISDSWIDQYVGFELYLPFCGSVKLDTATYIGKWVNVQYHIDYITGACTAYIGIPSAVNRSVSEFMEIRSGNCAIDVPISGIQQATLEANMFNATQQLKGAALKGVSSVVGNLISTAGKAAAKDIGGAVSAGFSTVGSIAGSVNEIQSAKFELQHTQLPARMIGSASALSGAEGYLSPMLIVTEPRLIEVPDNYGHTVGFACMRYGKLKDISSGYTEINSIDLDGIACTAEEKSIIRSVLAGGIYL